MGHYLKLYKQGQLQLGGPFLVPDFGGMMVTTKEVSYEQIEAFAAADPACFKSRSGPGTQRWNGVISANLSELASPAELSYRTLLMPKATINAPAPIFTLADYRGNQVSLSQFKGKQPVLLVFNRGFT